MLKTLILGHIEWLYYFRSTIGCAPIKQIEIPIKTGSPMASLMATIPYIYSHW